MAVAIEASKPADRGQSPRLLAGAWFAALMIYGFAIWRATDASAVWINNIAWTLAPACAAFICFRTALALDRLSSVAWWLLGAGCTSWLIGQLYWDYNQLVLGINMPFPNLSHIFYSSYPLFAIAAIARLPEFPNGAPLTLKHLGNVALVTCCLAVTVVLGLLEPAVQSGASTLFLWVGGLHALLVAATFLFALYSLWTYRWSTTWVPMLLLVIGSGIYSVTNLMYAHAVLTNEYLASDVLNVNYPVVFGFIAVAAAVRHWLYQHPYSASQHRLLRRERWLEAVVPALLIIIMVVVAVSTSAVLTGRVLAWSAGLFILFAIVLGIRESWIQSDAQRLTNELVNTNRRLQETNAELRDSEARYRDLNTALEKRVAERTAQLQSAYAELEGFSYAVAHDLKAPLRAINSFAHLLREEMGETVDERAANHINRIRSGSLKMAALIDDLLSYSHIERRELHESHVNVQSLVGSIVALYADELQRRNIETTIDVEPVTLFVDADGLSLVLRNLFENALKYTREASPPCIEIRARQTGTSVLFTLKDNGIGFDMQYHDHIFKVFQRLHREDQYPGTGIGLALVKKAVERLGGKVWAHSVVNHGATFYVELPGGMVTR